VIPAAAPAAASSSTSAIDKQVSEASTPAQVRALTEILRKAPYKEPPSAAQPKPASTAPAPAPEAAAPAAEQAAPDGAPEATQDAPAGEETPAADGQPAPEGEQPQAETPEPEAEEGENVDDGPITPMTAKRPRVNLPDTDEVGRLALSYQKRNRDWSLDQCMEAAKTQLGVAKKGSEQPADIEPPAQPGVPRNVEEADTLLEAKLVEYEKALADVRMEDAGKINREILKLERARSSLERKAEQVQAQEAVKYQSDFQSSEKKAIDLYPFAADPASPGGKRMIEIEKVFQETGDPRYFAANKPLLIAALVASEMNIAPKRSTPAPAKAAAPAAPVIPAAKKGFVPSGSSRTATPSASTPNPIDQQIQKVGNLAELRALHKSLGIRT
jgi:hypothetical protein